MNVSLSADIAAYLPGMRTAAESLHTDTFTVYRKTGATTTDPVTLIESPVFAVVLAGVAGKFQSGQSQPNDTQAAGQKITETGLTWHTSINTVGVLTDDEVLCTAVGPVGDPELVGRRVRVTGPFIKAYATARRYPVEETS